MNAARTTSQANTSTGAPRMSRIIAGAAGGSTADQRPREPDPAHDGPGQGSAVLPAGRLQRHCRRPRAGSVRGIRLAGRGERQPRRRTPWTWSNSTPRPAPSASGTRTWSTPSTGRKVVSVHRSKVESFLDRTADAVLWDLVFLDPPYPLDEPALAAVLAKLVPHLGEGAVVVVERSSRTPEPAWPDGHGTVCREEVRRNPAVVRRTRRGSRGADGRAGSSGPETSPAD